MSRERLAGHLGLSRRGFGLGARCSTATAARAAAYRTEHGLACPVLCDPDHVAYRAYGIGQWAVERILSEAPWLGQWRGHATIGRSMSLAIHLLGRPHIDAADGNTCNFRSRKSWAVLAYLILSERLSARSQLASLLVTEAGDPAASASLESLRDPPLYGRRRRPLGPAARRRRNG